VLDHTQARCTEADTTTALSLIEEYCHSSLCSSSTRCTSTNSLAQLLIAGPCNGSVSCHTSSITRLCTISAAPILHAQCSHGVAYTVMVLCTTYSMHTACNTQLRTRQITMRLTSMLAADTSSTRIVVALAKSFSWCSKQGRSHECSTFQREVL
jgi:hypothetical protein